MLNMMKLALVKATQHVIDMDNTTFSNDPMAIYEYLAKQGETDGGYDPKITLLETTPTLRAKGLVALIEREAELVIESYCEILRVAKDAMIEQAINDKFPSDLNELELKQMIEESLA